VLIPLNDKCKIWIYQTCLHLCQSIFNSISTLTPSAWTHLLHSKHFYWQLHWSDWSLLRKHVSLSVKPFRVTIKLVIFISSQWILKTHANYELMKHVNYEFVKHVNYELIKHVNYELVKHVNYELVKHVNYVLVKHVYYELIGPVQLQRNCGHWKTAGGLGTLYI